MTHILAFMDDTLHAATASSFFPGDPGSKRQVSVDQQRRVAGPRLAVAGGEAETAPVRMDRVRALRASIADGSYSVSSSDLAHKILHTMLQK